MIHQNFWTQWCGLFIFWSLPAYLASCSITLFPTPILSINQMTSFLVPPCLCLWLSISKSALQLTTAVLLQAEIKSFPCTGSLLPSHSVLKYIMPLTYWVDTKVLHWLKTVDPCSYLYLNMCHAHSKCLINQCQVQEELSKWMNALNHSLLTLVSLSSRLLPCQCMVI